MKRHDEMSLHSFLHSALENTAKPDAYPWNALMQHSGRYFMSPHRYFSLDVRFPV